MDIRKDQFGSLAVRLLQDIADSHFIAFDFEFSGIAERNRERASKATVEERYEETRASVQEYQPLQIGLTVVRFDPLENRYVLEPYNLNISPLPQLRERQFTRKWSMNSGAISFLHRNGFDFGKQMVHGVPYLSLQEEDIAREKMTAEAKRDDMVIKEQDQILVQHIRDSIATWQSQSKEQQEDYLNIPNGESPGIPTELNGYQRRLVYQTVQNEFPAMKTHGMGHFIQITNPTSDQQANQKAVEAEQRERDLARAIGFRWIIDGMTGKDLTRLPNDYILPALPPNTPASEGEKPLIALREQLNESLRSRRKVLIGHNCMVDIMFLYKMAVGDLPATLDEFREKFHELFPAVVDTKYLASSFSEKHGRLTLGDLEQVLNKEREVYPELYTSTIFDRYINNAYLHEAGYDSYITAQVAIKMAAKLHRDGTQRKQEPEAPVATHSSTTQDFGVQEVYTTAVETSDQIVSANPISEAAAAAAPQSQFTPIETSASQQEEPNQSSIGESPDPPALGEHDSSPSASPQSPPTTKVDTDTGTSNTSNNTSTTIPDKTSSSPFSKVLPSLRSKPQHTSADTDDRPSTDDSKLSRVRSAFASTSIYDALDSSNVTRMPGEEGNSTPKVSQDGEETEDEDEIESDTETARAKKAERLVREGRMMPRWEEESAFWEAYGNRLQVNGTVEGSIKLVD